ncbi:hypothetical protein CA13_38360 [Planctomycetes bacterium CA13]|uniref:Uncharacterized protein n=1 Tax=Novipirellula herctigrandis TaxID=2527986 RepID=A0A5C5Z551_9BACT|nr:hypothetical protein CA13_38360 [Planctomycetes bacterium CA13]
MKPVTAITVSGCGPAVLAVPITRCFASTRVPNVEPRQAIRRSR